MDRSMFICGWILVLFPRFPFLLLETGDGAIALVKGFASAPQILFSGL